MHEREGLKLQQKALLPTQFDPKYRREVDILITGSLAGYPVRVAIECKNHNDPISPAQIDEFKGKLESVGVPVSQGIFVAVNRFTDQAIARAKSVGIRTLTLEGLTPDRLESEVFEAFQSVVYLLMTVRGITIENEAQSLHSQDALVLYDENGTQRGMVPDLIWAMWRDGELPEEWGIHEVPVKVPTGWFWMKAGNRIESTATATVQLMGLILTFKGTATRHSLRDADSSEVLRSHISSLFYIPHGSAPVTLVETEEDLETVIQQDGVVTVFLGRHRLARILVLSKCFWPPSDRALQKIAQHAYTAARKGDIALASLQNLTFLDIEGSNLSRAWDPISPSHPASTQSRWPLKSRPKRLFRQRVAPPRARRHPLHDDHAV